MIRATLLALLLLVMGGLAYIRLAPHDLARWHQPLSFGGDRDFAAGVRRVIPGDADRLARLDAIIRATPRTRAIAGSVETGLVTYVTRSRVFGFPDYTTVALDEGELRILARLRFGAGDSGVNRARVEAWLAELDAA